MGRLSGMSGCQASLDRLRVAAVEVVHVVCGRQRRSRVAQSEVLRAAHLTVEQRTSVGVRMIRVKGEVELRFRGADAVKHRWIGRHLRGPAMRGTHREWFGIGQAEVLVYLPLRVPGIRRR